MTDTTAAHALLWDAWADVQRLDHYALGVLGALIAAPRSGLSRDALASYLPAFYLAGAACLLAALLALAIRRPRLA